MPVTPYRLDADNGDAPALLKPAGGLEWHNENGRLHSMDDRPALIADNGYLYWYQDGVLHRDDDRPAIVRPVHWLWARLSRTRLPHVQVPADARELAALNTGTWDRIRMWASTVDTPPATDVNIMWPGAMFWYQNGQPHRWNGPAVLSPLLRATIKEPVWFLYGERAEPQREARLTRAFEANRLTDTQAWRLAGDDPWVMNILHRNPRLSLSPRTKAYFALAGQPVAA